MHRSRLEKYLSILEALVSRSIELEDISFNTNIECRVLKRYLGYLISHNIVEAKQVKAKVFYSINDRGIAVLKRLRVQEYFGKLRNMLPLLKDAKEAQSLTPRRMGQNKG